MAGINIPFLANVHDFLKGTGSVEDALDDVAGSLDDVADEAQDASRATSRALDGAADDADDAAARLERSFRDSLDTVRAESADTGAAVGRNMDEGTREASEGMAQMGEEGAANAREVAASFDGSASSIADGFQGLAAEALGGFGPMGAAAGVAIAAGMGLAMSSIEKAKEEAQEAAEAVAEMASEMIDLRSAKLGPEQVQEALAAAASEAEDGGIKLQEWADAATEAGLDFGDYAAAMAGDSAAASRSLDEITKKLDTEKAAIKVLATAISDSGDARSAEGRVAAAQIAEHTALTDALEEQRGKILEATGVVDSASEVYDLYTEAVDSSSAAQIANTEEVEAAEEARQDLLDVTRGAIDAELDYLDALDEGTLALAENAAAGLDKNTAAGRENIRTVGEMVDATMAHADAVLAQTGDQAAANKVIEEGRLKIEAAGTAAGLSADEVNGYSSSLGLVPKTVSTAVAVTGTDTATTDLDGVTAPRTVAVTPSADLNGWQSFMDRTMSSLRSPQVVVTPRLGLKAV